MAVGSENCGKCGEPVTGKAMKIKERAYHEEKCFSCVECMKDLKAVPVYSREEKLYCERDYREKFVPKCGQCKDYVLDNCVQAMGKTWHQEHFSCCKCSKNFSKAKLGYHEHEGYAYCETCYTEHALPKCQGCSKPIIDKTIKALGGQWHISCLVCKECKSTFEGQKSFYSLEDEPICGPCAGIGEEQPIWT